MFKLNKWYKIDPVFAESLFTNITVFAKNKPFMVVNIENGNVCGIENCNGDIMNKTEMYNFLISKNDFNFFIECDNNTNTNEPSFIAVNPNNNSVLNRSDNIDTLIENSPEGTLIYQLQGEVTKSLKSL